MGREAFQSGEVNLVSRAPNDKGSLFSQTVPVPTLPRSCISLKARSPTCLTAKTISNCQQPSYIWCPSLWRTTPAILSLLWPHLCGYLIYFQMPVIKPITRYQKQWPLSSCPSYFRGWKMGTALARILCHQDCSRLHPWTNHPRFEKWEKTWKHCFPGTSRQTCGTWQV